MIDKGSAADGGMIQLEIALPRWLAKEFDYVFAEILNRDFSRLEQRLAERELAEVKGRNALLEIAEAIRRNPQTIRAGRLVRFLASLEDGARYPLDPDILRQLPVNLARACLVVLTEFQRAGGQPTDVDATIKPSELRDWLEAYGLDYEAEQRQLAQQLYEAQSQDEENKD